MGLLDREYMRHRPSRNIKGKSLEELFAESESEDLLKLLEKGGIMAEEYENEEDYEWVEEGEEKGRWAMPKWNHWGFKVLLIALVCYGIVQIIAWVTD